MNKLFGILAAVLLAATLPNTASAQCEGACSLLMKETGEMIFGCYYAPGSPNECFANATRCTVSRCMNALLTTPEGRVVGELACSASETPASRIATALSRIHAQISLVSLHARKEGPIADLAQAGA